MNGIRNLQSWFNQNFNQPWQQFEQRVTSTDPNQFKRMEYQPSPWDTLFNTPLGHLEGILKSGENYDASLNPAFEEYFAHDNNRDSIAVAPWGNKLFHNTTDNRLSVFSGPGSTVFSDYENSGPLDFLSNGPSTVFGSEHADNIAAPDSFIKGNGGDDNIASWRGLIDGGAGNDNLFNPDGVTFGGDGADNIIGSGLIVPGKDGGRLNPDEVYIMDNEADGTIIAYTPGEAGHYEIDPNVGKAIFIPDPNAKFDPNAQTVLDVKTLGDGTEVVIYGDPNNPDNLKVVARGEGTFDIDTLGGGDEKLDITTHGAPNVNFETNDGNDTVSIRQPLLESLNRNNPFNRVSELAKPKVTGKTGTGDDKVTLQTGARGMETDIKLEEGANTAVVDSNSKRDEIKLDGGDQGGQDTLKTARKPKGKIDATEFEKKVKGATIPKEENKKEEGNLTV